MPENIIRQNAGEIVFTLPALLLTPEKNQWVGISVHNGLLKTVLPAHFKYVIDPGKREKGDGKKGTSMILCFSLKVSTSYR